MESLGKALWWVPPVHSRASFLVVGCCTSQVPEAATVLLGRGERDLAVTGGKVVVSVAGMGSCRLRDLRNPWPVTVSFHVPTLALRDGGPPEEATPRRAS